MKIVVPKNVKEIVALYLKEHRFEGLFGNECGCQLSDLMPGCDSPENCQPGYKRVCGNDPCDDCTAEHEPGSFCISAERPVRTF